jgi:2-amino-4-hydroxy-6-hydroxymethyldihydropteridine diphosphokinase
VATIAYIALGSNLGDRKAILDGAIAALRESPGVAGLAVSSLHETDPVGGPAGQGRYLNAAAAVETTLDPLQLLTLLHSIEARFGRVRSARWGERTLDLDLLLFGDQIIATPELSVPHPSLTARRFVLEPLCEIAPNAVDPRTERKIADLLASLDLPGSQPDR